MGLFDKLFGKKEPARPDEAVIVYLDGIHLPDEVYRDYDLTTLAEHLEDAITVERAGKFDGSETGNEETALYMYGPDADELFAAIEPILKEYPLC